MDAGNIGRLRATIRGIVAQWTLVNLAIEHGWGGQNTRGKVDEMLEGLLEIGPNPGAPQERIEDFLYDHIDRLNVISDDRSVEQVSALIVQTRTELMRGEHQNAIRLAAEAFVPAAGASQSRTDGMAPPISSVDDVENEARGSRGEGDDDNDDVDENEASAIDEDGFTVVSRKNKRNHN